MEIECARICFPIETGKICPVTAMQAIGYRQVVEHLHGKRSLSETIELVKTKTRQFAKRQLTWFRKHANAKCIELKPDADLSEVVNLVCQST